MCVFGVMLATSAPPLEMSPHHGLGREREGALIRLRGLRHATGLRQQVRAGRPGRLEALDGFIRDGIQGIEPGCRAFHSTDGGRIRHPRAKRRRDREQRGMQRPKRAQIGGPRARPRAAGWGGAGRRR